MTSKISISKGNAKMGAIPSVSLPPVITCAKGCKCAKDCYAVKLCRIYPTVKKAYERNYKILMDNANAFFQQINDFCKTIRYFRWHVSGDIVSGAYFINMVSIAENNPHCKYLAFTKQFDIVNEYINSYGELPSNLKIIFSAWEGMEMNNPHDLPTAHVFKRDEEIPEHFKVCGGNCSDCICRGIGCWELVNGECMALIKH